MASVSRLEGGLPVRSSARVEYPNIKECSFKAATPKPYAAMSSLVLLSMLANLSPQKEAEGVVQWRRSGTLLTAVRL